MTGPACGNNPHHKLTDGDRRAVEDFKAYLADRAALRDRIAEATWAQYSDAEPSRTGLIMANPHAVADAVLAVLPATVDRAAALREVADWFEGNYPTTQMDGRQVAILLRDRAEADDALRRVADETAATETQPAVDLPTLAAALDGLHTLIATSSRDWGTYRVDAWIWAVLCGWDCEQTEHDATCTHGALEEMAEQHGWDDATVAKARRYRAAARTLAETHQPAAGARQDGAQQ